MSQIARMPIETSHNQANLQPHSEITRPTSKNQAKATGYLLQIGYQCDVQGTTKRTVVSSCNHKYLTR